MSLLSCLVLLACGDSDLTMVVPGDPTTPSLADAEVSLVSGDGQEGEVASILPEPLVVQVLDVDGNPIPNAPITWVFTDGAGVQGQGQPVTTRQVLADANGTATIEWQLGTTAGMQSASAEIVTPSTTSSADGGASAVPGNNRGKKVGFQARGKPSSARSVAISPDDPTLMEGDSIQLDADVSDKYGNVIDAVSVNWASTNEAVARVDNSGMVRAITTGLATIEATYESAEGSVTVTTNSTTNQLPVASIVSPSQDLTVTLGTAVDFRGSASDADGTIASHSWSFGDGSTSSSEDPAPYTYASAGTYNVTYNVIDNQGATSADARRTITVVTAGNQPPTAAITSPSQDVTINLGEAVDFQGTASDPDGTLTSHRWNFGDGNTSSAADPGPYTYASAGSYTVTYRVTDDQGAQSPDVSRRITVEDPSAPPPPPGTAIWSSDWVGASDWSDGGRWQFETGSPNHLRVGSNDPSAPTSHYLSVNVFPLGVTGSSAAVACPATQPSPPGIG